MNFSRFTELRNSPPNSRPCSAPPAESPAHALSPCPASPAPHGPRNLRAALTRICQPQTFRVSWIRRRTASGFSRRAQGLRGSSTSPRASEFHSSLPLSRIPRHGRTTLRLSTRKLMGMWGCGYRCYGHLCTSVAVNVHFQSPGYPPETIIGAQGTSRFTRLRNCSTGCLRGCTIFSAFLTYFGSFCLCFWLFGLSWGNNWGDCQAIFYGMGRFSLCCR